MAGGGWVYGPIALIALLFPGLQPRTVCHTLSHGGAVSKASEAGAMTTRKNPPLSVDDSINDEDNPFSDLSTFQGCLKRIRDDQARMECCARKTTSPKGAGSR